MSDFESSSSSTQQQEVPDGFICPISLELMRDPVMNRNGQTYERKSILQWLHKGNAHCPLTREPLRPSQLVPNNALKVRIRRWSKEHGISSHDCCEEQQDSHQYSHIEELGLMGFVDDNDDNSENSSANNRVGNPLADLSDLFDQVLEITSAD